MSENKVIPEDLKVINLGLPKSGTTTLAKALRRAGFTVADWRLRSGPAAGEFVGQLIYAGYFRSGDPLALLPGYDALTQIDVLRDGLNLWPQTDWGVISAIRAAHPSARFLASWRDPARLADSMDRWSDLGRRRVPEADIPGLPAGYGASSEQKIRWIRAHYRMCRHMFRDADDYREFDIADPDAPARIAGCLGVDLPWWGRANAGAVRQPG